MINLGLGRFFSAEKPNTHVRKLRPQRIFFNFNELALNPPSRQVRRWTERRLERMNVTVKVNKPGYGTREMRVL